MTAPWRPSRRLLLRSAAATLALPFLPSALSRRAWADAPVVPPRMLFFYVPCGLQPEEWKPENTGRGYDLKRILAPLAPVQDHVSVLSGLYNDGAMSDRAGDHARGTGAFLTAASLVYTAGSDIYNGTSVDQVAAQATGSATALPSMQLGIEGGGTVGDCDSGYSCAYARNISWSSPTTPLPSIVDPVIAFRRMFGATDPTLTAEDLARKKLLRGSVLDHVRTQANDLSARLGASDKAKLDEYLTGVRALEARIASSADQVCVPGEEPDWDGSLEEQTRLMLDLVFTGFECDVTRITSLMLGNGGSNRSHSFLGVDRGFHEISHHQEDAANLEDLYTIQTWEVGQLVSLLERMRDTVEADGTSMLDNSLVFFSSEIGDGDRHNHDDLPVLLAGGKALGYSPGQHIDFGERPLADLFLSMLATFGVAESTFGDSGTAPLEGL